MLGSWEELGSEVGRDNPGAELTLRSGRASALLDAHAYRRVPNTE